MDKLATFIFDFVIAVSIVLFACLIYFGLRTETVIQTMDNEITDEFLSDIKESGSLTTVDYESFLRQLSFTNVLYDISFEHKYKVMEPEYRMRTIEEIIAAQKAAYKGDNIYHYREVVTKKPIVTDPIDNSGLSMNTETNESVLAKSSNTPSSGHVHTDACYGGHRHKPTYGHDLKNIPVYFRYYYEAHDRGNYGYKLDVICSECDQIIYSIEFIGGAWNSYMDGYITYYYYNASGRYNTSRTRFTIYSTDPSYNTYVGIVESMKSYASTSYGYFEKFRCSGAMVYPYQGMIVSNGAGGLALAPFTGCNNKYYHPNTSCMPIGDVTAPVDVSYQRYYSQGSDGGDYFTMQITCNKCGKGIMALSGYLGNGGGYIYSAKRYINISVAEYAGDGSVRDRRYSASGTNIAPYIRDTLYDFETYVKTLPGLVNTQYGIRVNANGVRWNKLMIPYVYNTYWDTYGGYIFDEGTSNMVRWPGLRTGSFQYGGCLYCTPYGSILACGQSSVLECSDKVIKIEPTHPTQSIFIGEPLITTVTATFLDGSKKVVIAGTDFKTTNPVSKKTVTLKYTDKLGNINTCTLTVNVIPRTKVCGYGHTYNLNNDGSDPGCPFCKAYVLNIRVINPTTSTMTVTIGTTLQQNGLKLLVTYCDGHTEVITSEYEDNLDNQYLGTKPVTIGYKGATIQLMVTTVCAKMTCDRCGFVYELYPDGTNPGCPRCISKTPVFTGKVLVYEEVNYTNEILEELYDKEKYNFNTNDTFIVNVKSKTSTVARNLINLVFPSMNNRKWLMLKKSEAIKAK